jgi:hypothetical protein
MPIRVPFSWVRALRASRPITVAASAPAPVSRKTAYPRECPHCSHYVPAGVEWCPGCGFHMPAA